MGPGRIREVDRARPEIEQHLTELLCTGGDEHLGQPGLTADRVEGHPGLLARHREDRTLAALAGPAS